MRSLSAFILLFSLVLAASVVDARKDPEKYWKNIMDDEPMPKTLTNLLHQDPPSQSTGNYKEGLRDFRASNMGRFMRNFDTKPNIIIYHRQDEPNKATGHGETLHDNVQEQDGH